MTWLKQHLKSSLKPCHIVCGLQPLWMACLSYLSRPFNGSGNWQTRVAQSFRSVFPRCRPWRIVSRKTVHHPRVDNAVNQLPLTLCILSLETTSHLIPQMYHCHFFPCLCTESTTVFDSNNLRRMGKLHWLRLGNYNWVQKFHYDRLFVRITEQFMISLSVWFITYLWL